MNIKDKVRSKNKKGQIQEDGTLVGLIDVQFYIKAMMPKDLSPEILDITWGKNNPNWQEGLVAFVFFDQPMRTATLEEWVETGMAKGLDEEELKKEWVEECPMTQIIAVPSADLEVVNE